MSAARFINEALNGTTDSSQHHITLFALALSLRAKNVLELGVREGHTTSPLLEAVCLTSGKLTSVDIRDNGKISSEMRNNNAWNFVISDALSYLRSLSSEEMFDFVFIDDWHDGEHVAEELRLISNHITSSSLIVLHDTMCKNTQPAYHYYANGGKNGEFNNGGPFAAIEALDKNVWEYATVPVNNGLTILRKLCAVNRS
jgi:predicted O-methyltransferase YrrM